MAQGLGHVELLAAPALTGDPAAILSIVGGAQGSDAATLANKVAVGSYYDLQIFKHDAPFTIASAA